MSLGVLPYNDAQQALTMLTLFVSYMCIESIYIIKMMLWFNLHCIRIVILMLMVLLLL
jgi:hypothetical protein